MLALMALAMTPQDAPRHLLTFSRLPVLSGYRTEVAIFERLESGEPYFLLRRQVSARDRIVDTTWTDSIDCQSAMAVLHHAETLTLLHASPWEEAGQMRDGTYYHLEAAAVPGYRDKRLSLDGVDNSPLAEWMDAAFRDLRLCWQRRAPRRG